MKIFWMIFFATFIVGSMAIYAYAPKAAPRVLAFFHAEGSPAEDPMVSHVPVKVEAEPVRPAPEPLKTLDDDDVSPALEGIFPARSNEQPGWGITSHRVSYYKADGSYAGTVEGGVIFDCTKTVTSSKGTMIECRFLQEGMTDDPFLIGRKDAQFFTASHQKMSKSRTQALKDYYALNGKIEVRRTELLEKGAEQNPHFIAARVAHEAFQKNIQEAKRLEQMRDTLSDSKRVALEDKLRELKLKEVTLKKNFEEKQDKFVAWKKAHAAELPKPEDDTTIQEWAREKKRLAAALPGLAY